MLGAPGRRHHMSGFEARAVPVIFPVQPLPRIFRYIEQIVLVWASRWVVLVAADFFLFPVSIFSPIRQVYVFVRDFGGAEPFLASFKGPVIFVPSSSSS